MFLAADADTAASQPRARAPRRCTFAQAAPTDLVRSHWELALPAATAGNGLQHMVVLLAAGADTAARLLDLRRSF